jgi:hypothetical protein
MTEAHKGDLVLVYDLRRDHGRREHLLSQVQDQWGAYQRGEWPVHVSEGRISRLFLHPHTGEHLFELNEGTRRSIWIRQGDASWFIVGWQARVEQVVFHMPPPGGAVPTVTRIWVGNAA